MKEKPKRDQQLQADIELIKEFRDSILAAPPEKQNQALKEILEHRDKINDPTGKKLFSDLHRWLTKLIGQEEEK
jgi:hypothetical protein